MESFDLTLGRLGRHYVTQQGITPCGDAVEIEGRRVFPALHPGPSFRFIDSMKLTRISLHFSTFFACGRRCPERWRFSAAAAIGREAAGAVAGRARGTARKTGENFVAAGLPRHISHVLSTAMAPMFSAPQGRGKPAATNFSQLRSACPTAARHSHE